MGVADRAGLTDPVGKALVALLASRAGPEPVHVVDVGGGSGTRAVPLAAAGCRVTVIDTSIDALAILRRRSVEAGVDDRVVAVQGDAESLTAVVPAGSTDLVLCHHVLQELTSRTESQAVVDQMAAVLRPGGHASLVVPGRLAAVLALALAGRYRESAAVLGDPDGRSGPADPVAHRFEESELAALLERARLTVGSIRGSRVVADLLPGAVRLVQDTDELAFLEEALAQHPVTNRLGAELHAVARRPETTGTGA